MGQIFLFISDHFYLQSRNYFIPTANSNIILHTVYISSYSFDTTGPSFPYGSTLYISMKIVSPSTIRTTIRYRACPPNASNKAPTINDPIMPDIPIKAKTTKCPVDINRFGINRVTSSKAAMKKTPKVNPCHTCKAIIIHGSSTTPYKNQRILKNIPAIITKTNG